MRIGEVAAASKVGVQAVRYYERRGLLPEPKRHSSGQRSYTAATVQRVRFVKRAQALGFTLGEIMELLALWGNSAKSCQQVERRAAATLQGITAKIRDLDLMRGALAQYVDACHQRTPLEECPILRALGGSEEGDE